MSGEYSHLDLYSYTPFTVIKIGLLNLDLANKKFWTESLTGSWDWEKTILIGIRISKSISLTFSKIINFELWINFIGTFVCNNRT